MAIYEIVQSLLDSPLAFIGFYCGICLLIEVVYTIICFIFVARRWR